MYGILTETDKRTLERAMLATISAFPLESSLSIAEIGICHGDTARGMLGFFSKNGIKVNYFGVDNGKDRNIEQPFPGATLILGPSEDVHYLLQEPLNFLFIDGCHCANHIMLDFLNFGEKVRPNGIVAFHDIAPSAQGKGDYQGHGHRENLETGTSTIAALIKLGLWYGHREDWKLLFSDWDASADWGGIAVYQKVKV